MIKITAVFAALGALVLGVSPAQAGNEDELVSQSHRVESIVGSLDREFHTHFRHSRGYRYLRDDLQSIRIKADQIHGLAHDCEASLPHIQSELSALDAKARHLCEVVNAIERERYGGHENRGTRHMHGLLCSLSESIHAMKSTVQRIASHSHERGRQGRRDGYYEHRNDRRGPPHPAEIIGSIFRSIHGR